VVSATFRLFYTREIDTVPNMQEARWAPAPVWTVVEIVPLTGIRSPDSPAHSMSLYRRSYFGLYVKHFIQSLEMLIVAKPLNEFPTLKWKPVAYPGIVSGGEDRERGSGGGSPVVRISGGSCNLVQEISFHIVNFS
jgi:hypothetical protein